MGDSVLLVRLSMSIQSKSQISVFDQAFISFSLLKLLFIRTQK